MAKAKTKRKSLRDLAANEPGFRRRNWVDSLEADERDEVLELCDCWISGELPQLSVAALLRFIKEHTEANVSDSTFGKWLTKRRASHAADK